MLLRLSPGGAVGATLGSGAAGAVVASFAASAGGCMRGITSVREEAAGVVPSVAVPHAMQRTAATTFKKSHDGQTTPRLLVNSAGMSGP